MCLCGNQDDFGIFKINRQQEEFTYPGRPVFCPYFKVNSTEQPQIEELMDRRERYYYRSYHNDSKETVVSDADGTHTKVEEEEDEGFSPKNVQIFDTSMFKSGLNFRNSINERIIVDKDATRGLVSYTQYLHGELSSTK